MDIFTGLDEKLVKYQVLDRCSLKLLAVFTMLVDHLGAVFFEDAMWMRCIGRLAMPIFCFFVAEGYYHTRDRKKYLLRMGIFALISEIPFDLAFYDHLIYPGHQNVILTFFLAIVAVMAYDELASRFDGTVGRALGAASVLLVGLAAIVLKSDYNVYGVALVFFYYIFRGRGRLSQVSVALMFQLFTRGTGLQAWAMASAVPLLMYNGQKGRPLKWFFYCFYPGHLLILGVLHMLL